MSEAGWYVLGLWGCAMLTMIATQLVGIVRATKARGDVPEPMLSSVRLAPGDALVLTAPGTISDTTAARIVEAMERKFPGHDCLAFGDGVRVGVMQRGAVSQKEAGARSEVEVEKFDPAVSPPLREGWRAHYKGHLGGWCYIKDSPPGTRVHITGQTVERIYSDGRPRV